MSGTEKKGLLVVGKATNPRCFKKAKLPVDFYFSSRKAWMNSRCFVRSLIITFLGDIFELWLRSWDDELVRASRKILLFVDGCSMHKPINDLKNIELRFFPPNTTSRSQVSEIFVLLLRKSFYLFGPF